MRFLDNPMNNIPLALRLPALLPKAIGWAEGTARFVDQRGQALVERDLALARRVGVAQPELVRIAVVKQMPWPDDPALHDAGVETGLFSPTITGLTLGHAILIVKGHVGRRLIAHELRHVHQYEKAGSIAKFLPAYLYQVATMGYDDAPFEIDARKHEYLADESS
jgi:hypothetical protein